MNFLLFVATVLIWGTTWLAIAMQVGPVPALVSVFYRFLLGGLILLVALFAVGKLRYLPLKEQPYLIAQGCCLCCFNFICFYNAAHFVPSGLISVIFSLATILNAVNAYFIFGDKITARTLIAAMLGITGLVLLFARDIFLHFDMDTLKGMGLCLLGTTLFSLGNMVSRRNSREGIAPITANAWAMAYGSIILLVLVGITRSPMALPMDVKYLSSLFYLAVFGSVIGFTTYLMLVDRWGSAKAAYVTVLFPIVALALSTVYEDYQWHWTGALGIVLTLLGNLIIFWQRKPTVKAVSI